MSNLIHHNNDVAHYKVQIYLYDLSQGMAATFSPSLLGKKIDGIWHSGVVVYGYEYFYGGGIQSTMPGQTMVWNILHSQCYVQYMLQCTLSM